MSTEPEASFSASLERDQYDRWVNALSAIARDDESLDDALDRLIDGAESHECYSCGEESHDACRASERACGHHCNHVWTHDACCWCHEKASVEDGV